MKADFKILKLKENDPYLNRLSTAIDFMTSESSSEEEGQMVVLILGGLVSLFEQHDNDPSLIAIYYDFLKMEKQLGNYYDIDT